MKQLWGWFLEYWFPVTVAVASGTVFVGLVLR